MSGTARPTNSLLQEDLTFDQLTRPGEFFFFFLLFGVVFRIPLALFFFVFFFCFFVFFATSTVNRFFTLMVRLHYQWVLPSSLPLVAPASLSLLPPAVSKEANPFIVACSGLCFSFRERKGVRVGTIGLTGTTSKQQRLVETHLI